MNADEVAGAVGHGGLALDQLSVKGSNPTRLLSGNIAKLGQRQLSPEQLYGGSNPSVPSHALVAQPGIGRPADKKHTQMNTKELGDLSEMAVCKSLIERGYTVSITFGDSERYDLIYDDGENLYRAQVKTANLREGTLRFRCQNVTTQNGDTVRKPYTSDEVDVYLVYSPDRDQVYEVPISEAPKTQMELRLTDSKTDHPSINWASEYVLQ